MDGLCNHLKAKAPESPHWFRLYCWCTQVKSVFLYGKRVPCDDLLAGYHPDPKESPLRQALRLPAREAVRRFRVFVWRRLVERVGEAKKTTSLEFGVVFFDWAMVFLLVVFGDAFTKGWAIMGEAITQPEFGLVLAVQSFARVVAIVLLPSRWRYGLTWSSLLIHGATAYCVREANQSSIALAALVIFGVAGDCWVLWNAAENTTTPNAPRTAEAP